MQMHHGQIQDQHKGQKERQRWDVPTEPLQDPAVDWAVEKAEMQRSFEQERVDMARDFTAKIKEVEVALESHSTTPHVPSQHQATA